MSQPIAEQKPPGRRARQRAEKHGRLLEAARGLFAERGVEATSINDITERADVGFGSFYTYFEDKDAIVEAVVHATTEAHGRTVDELTANLDDPAEVVAVAHRHFVCLAIADPTWGRLVLRLESTHRILARALGERALRDVERGVEAGRFAVDALPLTLLAVGGALLGTITAVLAGPPVDDADVRHAELVLRMLGLPVDQAAAVAARPLPTA